MASARAGMQRRPIVAAGKSKEPLYWMNPLSHHVYDGWLELLADAYDLTVIYYDGVPRPQYRTVRLRSIRNFRVIDTTAGFYRMPPLPEDARLIAGDIYTNNLCWRLRGRRTLYYTEYFRYSEGLGKRFAFWFTQRWFRGKRFIVPTRHTLGTVRTFTDKALYFPQIHSGALVANKRLGTGPLKLLFVGVLRDWKKNVAWLLDTLAKLPIKAEITLCGLQEGFPVEEYQKLLGKRVRFLAEVPHEKLAAVYGAHNALILPSIVDPIGAVVLEAMAHGLPVVVGKQVGASSYVRDGVNGFVIEPNEKELGAALRKLQNPSLRTRFGAASLRIVREEHWLGNPSVRRRAVERLERLFDA